MDRSASAAAIATLGRRYCWSAWLRWPRVAVRADGAEPSRQPETPRAKADPAAVEFFEKSVRPILAARCQGCHGPAKQKGGLRLDARAAVIAGGSTGPAVVPGNPKESLLVDAINYGETYQMPPKSKLPDRRDRHLDRMGQARRSLGCRDANRLGGPAAAKPAGEIRQALEGRIPGTRSILELPAARPRDAPRRETPAAATGRATRSIASSWRRSRSTGSRRRPRPTGGR